MDIGHCSCSCSSSSSPHIWLGLAAAKWIYSAADRPDHRENDIRCLWHRCLQNFMECAHLLLLLPTEELTTNSWDYDISNSSALSSVIEVTVGDVCKLPGMSSTMCSGFCGCSVWQSELINFIYLMCKFHFLACSSSHAMVITSTFVGTFSQHSEMQMQMRY